MLIPVAPVGTNPDTQGRRGNCNALRVSCIEGKGIKPSRPLGRGHQGRSSESSSLDHTSSAANLPQSNERLTKGCESTMNEPRGIRVGSNFDTEGLIRCRDAARFLCVSEWLLRKPAHVEVTFVQPLKLPTSSAVLYSPEGHWESL